MNTCECGQPGTEVCYQRGSSDEIWFCGARKHTPKVRELATQGWMTQSALGSLQPGRQSPSAAAFRPPEPWAGSPSSQAWRRSPRLLAFPGSEPTNSPKTRSFPPRCRS